MHVCSVLIFALLSVVPPKTIGLGCIHQGMSAPQTNYFRWLHRYKSKEPRSSEHAAHGAGPHIRIYV